MAFNMEFLLSMIINNFYVVWTIFPPFEANSPLLVYADALLAGPVSTQRFKSIAGKIHQVFDAGGAVKDL